MRISAGSTFGVLGMFTMIVVGCVASPYGSEGSPDKNKAAPTTTTGSTTPSPGSSSTPTTPTATPTAPQTKPPPPVDIQNNPDGGSTDGGPTGACPGQTPVEGYIWKAPAAQAKSCTASDIGFFEGQLSSNDVTFASLEAGMRSRNVACASCIFSHIDDVTWGPVVFVSAQGAFQNWGSCYVRAPGGSEACGREVQNWYGCLTDACGACGSEAAISACQDKVAYDPTSCGRFDPAKVCGAALEGLNTACATAAKSVSVLCGP